MGQGGADCKAATLQEVQGASRHALLQLQGCAAGLLTPWKHPLAESTQHSKICACQRPKMTGVQTCPEQLLHKAPMSGLSGALMSFRRMHWAGLTALPKAAACFGRLPSMLRAFAVPGSQNSRLLSCHGLQAHARGGEWPRLYSAIAHVDLDLGYIGRALYRVWPWRNPRLHVID